MFAALFACCLAFVIGGDAAGAARGPGFTVRLDPSLDGSASGPGRLVVYVIRPDASVSPRRTPADAPFYEDPQPLYGLDRPSIAPGETVELTDRSASGFPGAMADLPPGSYRAQAVYDQRREFGSWRREEGNLFSGVVRFRVEDDGSWTGADLVLSETVGPARTRAPAGVEYVEIPSGVLTEFRGRPTSMRAGVVFPVDHRPGEAYPALYVVPGFGGDHTMAGGIAARRRDLEPGSPGHTLASSVFTIVLDPDGPFGHTLLADSANNGPVARALVEELIPALEARFGLIARPEARLLNGHSSGGWSTLWLATEHPETFGATWSSAPDPVDFHAFQKIDLYAGENMYTRPAPDGGVEPIPSYTEGGEVLMTVRQEIGVENVIGPGNTSGQQWHSWMAVFAPRGADGLPAALYDPAGGAIDPGVAGVFRAYDIAARLRADPARFASVFRERVRLVVGGADSYDLHLAVIRLRDTLREVDPRLTMEVTPGSITIVPGADHSDVLASEAVRAWPADMVTHLRRSGLPVRADATP
tara:strand:- start:25279 stop:26868 length:1590 start_codon:yes stop_codon:yes gene_type:complete